VQRDPQADDIKRLQGCITDLLSVLALPALWSGHESSQMADTLLDVLLRLLRLDFAYVRLSDEIDGAPIEVVRVAQQRRPAAQPRAVGQALRRWLTTEPCPAPCVITNPVGPGEVSIARFRLGLEDAVGVVVAGAQRADFPTTVERLLGGVAANQAAIGLQEARRMRDQQRAAAEVVVLDLTMPELNGLEAAKAMRAAVPATEILIFTMHESEELIRAALASGVRAVVVKSDVEGHLIAAVESLLRHDVYFSSRVSETLRDALLRAPTAEVSGAAPATLTEREREVTRLLAEGKSNKKVATALAITVRTVETHRASIMRKLEIKSIVELVHYAVRHNLVRP
jgi:DNA-binding NarL/FixJ family response regulator